MDIFEQKLAGILERMYPASALPRLHLAGARAGHQCKYQMTWSHGWTFIISALALSGPLLPMSQDGVYLFIGDLGINLSSWVLLLTSAIAALVMVPINRLSARRGYA